jgi:chromosome segregation ATPase
VNEKLTKLKMESDKIKENLSTEINQLKDDKNKLQTESARMDKQIDKINENITIMKEEFKEDQLQIQREFKIEITKQN